VRRSVPDWVQERAATSEQRTSAALDERCKGRLNVADAPSIQNDELLPDRKRCGLHVSSVSLGIRIFRVHENGDCRRSGHELAQQLQSLRPHNAAKKAHARDVATRTVQVGDEAVLDRVAPGHEDDRHRRGRGLGRECRSQVPDDHGHRPANQISHQSRQPINLIVRIAIFDCDVLALDDACFLQALAERGHEVRRVGG